MSATYRNEARGRWQDSFRLARVTNKAVRQHSSRVEFEANVDTDVRRMLGWPILPPRAEVATWLRVAADSRMSHGWPVHGWRAYAINCARQIRLANVARTEAR
jgi:hypothetical protein